jgi:hypothetical protein
MMLLTRSSTSKPASLVIIPRKYLSGSVGINRFDTFYCGPSVLAATSAFGVFDRSSNSSLPMIHRRKTSGSIGLGSLPK